MAVEVRCPKSECGKRYHLEDELVGKKVKCPACGTVFAVRPAQPVFVPIASARPSKAPPPRRSAAWLVWPAAGVIVAVVLLVVFALRPGRAGLLKSPLGRCLERIRKERFSLLLSSVPLGVDVCLDDSPGYESGWLLRQIPMAPAEADRRYVGRTPLVVTVRENAAIYFCYSGKLDEVAHGGRMLWERGTPDYHSSGVIFLYRARYPQSSSGDSALAERSVIVLLQANEPEIEAPGSDRYSWPKKPLFTTWESRHGAAMKEELATLGAPQADIDRTMRKLVSTGIAAVETSQGFVTYCLALGPDGNVAYQYRYEHKHVSMEYTAGPAAMGVVSLHVANEKTGTRTVLESEPAPSP